MANRKSNSEQRKAREARNGFAMVAAVVLTFGAMVAGAAYADHAQGVSAAHSLSAWGN